MQVLLSVLPGHNVGNTWVKNHNKPKREVELNRKD